MADEAPAVTPPVVDPPAPDVPAVTPPVETPPPAPPELTPEETAAKAEDDEWAEAQEEIFPGIKVDKKEVKKDEPAKPDEKPEEPETPPANPDPEKPDAPAGVSDGTDAKDKGAGEAEEEAGAPDSTARDTRVAQREARDQLVEIGKDVREKMFSNLPQTLQDSDGDPIRSIDDVMKLVNPRTGDTFTEEAAGAWLLSAQQEFNQNMANIDKQVEAIAEANADLKDEADSVNYRYGELLKSMPEVRQKLWASYEKTLVKDPETGIVIAMPVSLEDYYDIALAPYAKLVEGMNNTKEADEANAKKEADDKAAKEAEDEAKAKRRHDRSDVYAGGKIEDMDDEEKEWNDAAVAVFGPRK